MRALIPSLLLIPACGVGCGGSRAPTTNPDLATTDMMSVSNACVPAGYTALPFVTTTPERSFSQAEPSLVAGKDYVAVLDTDAGCIVFDLYENDAPTTVNSFVFLTLHHFFDGIAFHRVIDGFMAQTGDPNTVDADQSTWGTGGPGYSFGLETVPGRNYDGAGVVGMARTNDPNSNGSQFFITFTAVHDLDQMYTVFGGVENGLDVLPKIHRGEPPSMPTRIKLAFIAVK